MDAYFAQKYQLSQQEAWEAVSTCEPEFAEAACFTLALVAGSVPDAILKAAELNYDLPAIHQRYGRGPTPSYMSPEHSKRRHTIAAQFSNGTLPPPAAPHSARNLSSFGATSSHGSHGSSHGSSGGGGSGGLMGSLMSGSWMSKVPGSKKKMHVEPSYTTAPGSPTHQYHAGQPMAPSNGYNPLQQGVTPFQAAQPYGVQGPPPPPPPGPYPPMPQSFGPPPGGYPTVVHSQPPSAFASAQPGGYSYAPAPTQAYTATQHGGPAGLEAHPLGSAYSAPVPEPQRPAGLGKANTFSGRTNLEEDRVRKEREERQRREKERREREEKRRLDNRRAYQYDRAIEEEEVTNAGPIVASGGSMPPPANGGYGPSAVAYQAPGGNAMMYQNHGQKLIAEMEAEEEPLPNYKTALADGAVVLKDTGKSVAQLMSSLAENTMAYFKPKEDGYDVLSQDERTQLPMALDAKIGGAMTASLKDAPAFLLVPVILNISLAMYKVYLQVKANKVRAGKLYLRISNIVPPMQSLEGAIARQTGRGDPARVQNVVKMIQNVGGVVHDSYIVLSYWSAQDSTKLKKVIRVFSSSTYEAHFKELNERLSEALDDLRTVLATNTYLQIEESVGHIEKDRDRRRDKWQREDDVDRRQDLSTLTDDLKEIAGSQEALKLIVEDMGMQMQQFREEISSSIANVDRKISGIAEKMDSMGVMLAKQLEKIHLQLDRGTSQRLEDLPDYVILRSEIRLDPKGPFASGAFGSLYKATWRSNDCVAVKTFQRPGSTDEVLRELNAEAFILRGLRHPNIVMFYGTIMEPGQYALVMEYYKGGSLYDYLQKIPRESLGWLARVNLALGIASGMEYLHSRKPVIVHGDLKAANIVLNSKNQRRAVICDFGLSQEVKSKMSRAITGGQGTLRWTAPELLSGVLGPSKASDVYSFGMIMYEITTHIMPYGRAPEMAIGELITKGVLPDVPQDSQREMPGEYHKLMKDCLLYDAKKRPEFEFIRRTLKALSEKLQEARHHSS